MGGKEIHIGSKRREMRKFGKHQKKKNPRQVTTRRNTKKKKKKNPKKKKSGGLGVRLALFEKDGKLKKKKIWFSPTLSKQKKKTQQKEQKKTRLETVGTHGNKCVVQKKKPEGVLPTTRGERKRNSPTFPKKNLEKRPAPY